MRDETGVTSGDRRRGSARVMALLIIGALAAPLLVALAPANARITKPDEIQAWTANLRKMHHLTDSRWKRFVWRVANHPVKPDVIALTEVCNVDYGGGPGNDAKEFVHYLEEKTGSRYSWRHSGQPGTSCFEANTMIVWRTARFSLDNNSAVRQWLSFHSEWAGDTLICSQTKNGVYKEIAVALWDELQKKSIVATSVHFNVEVARKCINENIALMDRVLEGLKPTRRLTIAAGDFNQTPAREEPTTGDEATTGTQTDPACWYRTLAMLTTGDGTRCSTHRPHRLTHYDPRRDYYVDTVHAVHQGARPGTTMSSICDEWTHSRSWAGQGSGCTDLSGREQRPDGLMDRGRIDYIWARWESPSGRPRTFQPDEAASLVSAAAADKPEGPMYADHRAVRALIKWCLASDGCRN